LYQALYRKYRPRTFDDVSGQTHITRTLKNQVSSERCSHAYLFVGARGTGKTSCAKLLARAVNCEHPENGNPCNACPSCLAALDGSATDILELDAASNNGVDNVRALREDAVFSPVSLKKRVYIVDEVHMLSGSAFNALLKILEEPPEHLIFILATTELHRVPATIVSRCQRFSFRRISREDVAARLYDVAGAEGFAIASDAASTLARLSDGSLRDALSLLDQCADGGDVDMARVREVVGMPPRDLVCLLAESIALRDAKKMFELLDELYRGGLGASALFDELADILRDALVLKLIPDADSILSGAAEPGELAALTEQFDAGRLTYILGALTKRRSELTQSAFDRTTAELCLASLCDARLDGGYEALLARIEALERPGNTRSAPRRETVSPRAGETAPDASPRYSLSETASAENSAVLEDSAPRRKGAAARESAPETPAADGAFWQGILSRLKAAGGMLVLPFVSDAKADLKGDILTVTVSDPFAVDMLARENAAAALKNAAEAELGRSVALVTKLVEKAPGGDSDTASVSPEVLNRLSSRLGDLIKFEE
jgi:DNA polymerase-3 subunit gamma/tau